MKDIDREAKTLLADLLLDANQPVSDSLLSPFDSAAVSRSEVLNFMSMVRFPRNGGTRLVADPCTGRRLSLLRHLENATRRFLENLSHPQGCPGGSRPDAPV
jgi:predicted lysophospholipase L1 biosynthesis ABC-type transport system permease subunit